MRRVACSQQSPRSPVPSIESFGTPANGQRVYLCNAHHFCQTSQARITYPAPAGESTVDNGDDPVRVRDTAARMAA
jgi:hypothetical protein